MCVCVCVCVCVCTPVLFARAHTQLTGLPKFWREYDENGKVAGRQVRDTLSSIFFFNFHPSLSRLTFRLSFSELAECITKGF